jgi:putative hydrolase of the HAD superfamily
VIEAVISDFGGVMTTPLSESFWKASEEAGVPSDALRKVMGLLAEREPEPPLFALERGQISEGVFLDKLADGLAEVLGRRISLDGYAHRLMAAMQPNEPLLSYYRTLKRDRGIRIAVLTNNVREWQPLWREPLRVDELAELVVDSSFVGMRKPEPGIYELTLERLGLPAGACVFVDDLEINLPPARALGIHTVHFRHTAQAVSEIDALVVGP